jgi:hypothetical protein
VVRGAACVDDLLGTPPTDWQERLEALYPESLIAEIARLRQLHQEVGQLRAIEAGFLQAAQGVVLHRGRNLRRRDLPKAIEEVQGEAHGIEQRLWAEDRLCRTVHFAAATALGADWAPYLRGLVGAVHYADHTAANLGDLRALLTHTVQTVTITRRVSKRGVQRVVESANALYDALREVYGASHGVKLDATLRQRINIGSWAELFEDFKLGQAATDNIDSWLKVIDGWVDQALGACDALRDASLETLLMTEAFLAEHIRAGTSPEQAPAPSIMPPEYDCLLIGAERPRRRGLTWWQRFQIADGILPAMARFAVAATIVGVVLGLGGGVGTGTITVYNGLATHVVFSTGTGRVQAPPRTAHEVQVDAGESYTITARTLSGQTIDSFTVEVPKSFGSFIYNVAGATPLLAWTAVYGNVQPVPPQLLGAPRWSKAGAGILFRDPPETISTSTGGGTVEVISAMSEWPPERQLNPLTSDSARQRMARAHARWDATSSRDISGWMLAVQQMMSFAFDTILDARLAEAPNDVVLLRMQQDRLTGTAHDSLCVVHQQRAAAAPADGDWAYLAARCLRESKDQMAAFLRGRKRWPEHPWFAYATGYGYVEAGAWQDAVSLLEEAVRRLPPISNHTGLDLARVHRVLGHDSTRIVPLLRSSPLLETMVSLETGTGWESTAMIAYAELARGALDDALRAARADSEVEARVLRLAAASDGSSPTLVRRALRLGPDAGMDLYTRWVTIALAAREGREFRALIKTERGASPRHTEALTRFLEAARRPGAPLAAERELRDLPLSLRGLAYSMAVVTMGTRAPSEWREEAKRLLFSFERPYFR